MKTLIYCRVSTSEQEDGWSLDAQEAALLEYCARQQWPACQVIREAQSARVPLGKRAIGKCLADGQPARVVAVRLDRLFRSVLDAMLTLRDWTESGVIVHFLDFGGSPVDTSSPQGKLFLTMLAAFAEFERGMISVRTKEGLRKAAAAGKGRKPVEPYGRDATELHVLGMLREWRAAGMSYHFMADRLNKDGARTRSRGMWFANTVRRILEK